MRLSQFQSKGSSRERRSPDRLFAFFLFVLFSATFFAQSARAEYIVLKSGQRLVVTGYQLVGDTYKLQLTRGSAEIPASEVVAIEPEEIFHSTPKPALADLDVRS